MIDEKKKFIRMGYAGHTQLIHLLAQTMGSQSLKTLTLV